jgi:hypothetical protein
MKRLLFIVWASVILLYGVFLFVYHSSAPDIMRFIDLHQAGTHHDDLQLIMAVLADPVIAAVICLVAGIGLAYLVKSKGVQWERAWLFQKQDAQYSREIAVVLLRLRLTLRRCRERLAIGALDVYAGRLSEAGQTIDLTIKRLNTFRGAVIRQIGDAPGSGWDSKETLWKQSNQLENTGQKLFAAIRSGDLANMEAYMRVFEDNLQKFGDCFSVSVQAAA